jgi:excisionase family DNA binding protein
MSSDGWAELERLRALVSKAQSNGAESVRLDRLAAWLERAVASRVATGVASEPDPVVMDPVSVRTAASLLSVSAQRVRVLCASGKLPAIRTRQGWMISRAAVLNRRDQGETDQGSRPAA